MNESSVTRATVTASQPEAIEICCGAGGLAYGLASTGIRVLAGVDIDPSCRYPFETNLRARFIHEDIAALPDDFATPLFSGTAPRILAAGVPCQPFSPLANTARNQRDEWKLLTRFREIVLAVRPEIVALENVPQLAKYPIFREFVDALEGAGYAVCHTLTRADDYGVPQTRKRLVLLASLLGQPQLESPPALRQEETVEGAIGHMEPLGSGQMSTRDPLHVTGTLTPLNLNRIRQSRPGGSWRDWDDELVAACHRRESGGKSTSVYGRMRWDAPAPTITTKFHVYGTGRFGHPEQDRTISLREAALLQGFPEGYEFVPPGAPVHLEPIARLVGNAVPIGLAAAVGRSIMAHLNAASAPAATAPAR